MRAAHSSPAGLWARRLGWMVLLWTASVVGLAIVAMIFRGLMALAGLTP
jgi:NO-binding membrane sensor protein with MHYT domain